MKRADGIVAEEGKDAVPVIAKPEMSCSLELVDKVEAARVVRVLPGLDKALVEEGNVRRADTQCLAEMMVALESLSHTG